MNNKALQRHLLTANTSTVASTVLAIEEYLVVCSSEWSSCKTAGEGSNSPQMGRIVHVLTPQSEVMVTTMTKLEAMTLASK